MIKRRRCKISQRRNGTTINKSDQTLERHTFRFCSISNTHQVHVLSDVGGICLLATTGIGKTVTSPCPSGEFPTASSTLMSAKTITVDSRNQLGLGNPPDRKDTTLGGLSPLTPSELPEVILVNKSTSVLCVVSPRMYARAFKLARRVLQ